MSAEVAVISLTDEDLKDKDDVVQEDDTTEEDEVKVQEKDIIRYSLSTLLSIRSSKLSQGKPVCKNLDLACMAHHKPPPKMLIANMMPKFALNQMQNRGEESGSPLSFHSNSSSSLNLSYPKRFQENSREGESYSNSRYYNKYKNYDDNGSLSTRIIYKTTGANANNGNNSRFLKKAYNSKYDNSESSVGLISNKNILENSSRVITAADHRNLKKNVDLSADDDKKIEKGDDKEKPTPDKASKENSKEQHEGNKANADDTGSISEENKNLPDDITNHLDDMFNNMSQMLPEKITDERESSRFSKWFTVDKEDSKEEKDADLQNNNNDNSKMFTQSVESEKYFQPIDKVKSNSLFQIINTTPGQMDVNPFMQIIQTQKQQQQSPNSGQVHSVEELEARLRQHNFSDESNSRSTDGEQKVLQNFLQQQIMPNLMHQQPSGQNQNQEDVNAFKKLLSQMANEENKITQNEENLPQQMMMKPFPQHGADVMMQQQQQQQQKNFPMASKNSSKMINSMGQSNPISQHMIPSQQFGNNIDMMKFMQQQKVPVRQQPEVMKRPEVQAIVQELASGEISQYSLWQRLTTPGLSPIERDVITSALNFFNSNSNPNGNSALFPKQTGTSNLFQQMKPAAPIPVPQGSPISPIPPSLDQHLLFQHHQAAAVAANKLRLSPLPATGIPQRIPSPRELQYHTQSIMQNALIRKKLEEQRENFRKRQEQEQKEQLQKQGGERKSQDLDGTAVSSPNQSSDEIPKIGLMDSPIRKAPAQQQVQRQHAPSPSMFTPTSVLRKMTAERDSDVNKKKAITGTQFQQQPRTQQQQYMGNLTQLDRMMQIQAQNEAFGKVNWDGQSSMKPQGRPIVKGAGPGQPNSMMTQGSQQSNMVGNFDFQQQQIQNMNMQKQFLQQQQQQQIIQMKKQQQMDNPVLTQFMAQHQQRTQQQQQQQNMMHSQQFPQQMNYQQQMMQGRSKDQHEMDNRNVLNNDGCLSPTSNQLAKWFSPELLADASAGKLPSAKMNGQMLSLEEFEKCIQNS